MGVQISHLVRLTDMTVRRLVVVNLPIDGDPNAGIEDNWLHFTAFVGTAFVIRPFLLGFSGPIGFGLNTHLVEIDVLGVNRKIGLNIGAGRDSVGAARGVGS